MNVEVDVGRVDERRTAECRVDECLGTLQSAPADQQAVVPVSPGHKILLRARPWALARYQGIKVAR